MLKIGVTGGIGSGKSTVCKIFSCLGIPVYEADTAAKILMNSDDGLKVKLKKEFGDKIYDPSGELNRKALSEIVFNNAAALKKINSLVHPAVRTDFRQWLQKNSSAAYVIEEAAILFESGAYKETDYVITVAAPESLRFKRVMLRDNVNEEEVKSRAKNQMTDAERNRLAQFVIINDEAQLLIPQVLQVHHHLLDKAKIPV